MQRNNSKASVGSVESSRGSGRKPAPTHVIIQRENGDDLLLLPVTHLVNAVAARIKLNDTATFKIDLNSRKQERGMVLSFGSEDVCAEQMQILDMNTPGNQENRDPHSDSIKKQSEKQRNNNKRIDQRISTPSTGQSQNPKPIIGSSKNHTRAKGSGKTVSPSNIEKDRAVAVHGKGKTAAHQETLGLVADDSLDETECSTMAKNASRHLSSSNDRSSQMKILSKSINQAAPTPSSRSVVQTFDDDTTSSIEVEQEQQQKMQQQVSYDVQDKTREKVNLSIDDVPGSSYDFLSKKCNKLLKENALLQLECDRLTKEIHQLKRTTIPMPDQDARQWFLDVAKIFSSKSNQLDILHHARRLGIKNPEDLVSCLQDTTSNTARKIVRLLYSPQQLLTMSGTEIPTGQRQAIRDIAEAHKGPISNHKFNEAINGVFRSRKQEVMKKRKDSLKGHRDGSPVEESLDRTGDE